MLGSKGLSIFKPILSLRKKNVINKTDNKPNVNEPNTPPAELSIIDAWMSLKIPQH